MFRCLLWAIAAAVRPKALPAQHGFGFHMSTEVRQPTNHRHARTQKRRSASSRCGRGLRRCRTSSCCRRQRLSPISGAVDPDPSHDHRESTLGSAQDPGGARAAWVQSWSPSICIEVIISGRLQRGAAGNLFGPNVHDLGSVVANLWHQKVPGAWRRRSFQISCASPDGRGSLKVYRAIQWSGGHSILSGRPG
jgi:hypothetical protein